MLRSITTCAAATTLPCWRCAEPEELPRATTRRRQVRGVEPGCSSTPPSGLHSCAAMTGRKSTFWSRRWIARGQKVDFLPVIAARSEEHTSELQSHSDLVCRLLLEKKKIQ